MIDGLSEDDLTAATMFTKALWDIQNQTAAKLHIPVNELTSILNGTKQVKRVVLKDKKSAVRTAAKWVGFALMAVLLLCCLVFEGFADGLRFSVIRVFVGPESTHVETTHDDNAHTHT